MPKPKPISQILREVIPHGMSCAGCRYLDTAKGSSITLCKMFFKEVHGKECGINEGEE